MADLSYLKAPSSSFRCYGLQAWRLIKDLEDEAWVLVVVDFLRQDVIDLRDGDAADLARASPGPSNGVPVRIPRHCVLAGPRKEHGELAGALVRLSEPRERRVGHRQLET